MMAKAHRTSTFIISDFKPVT